MTHGPTATETAEAWSIAARETMTDRLTRRIAVLGLVLVVGIGLTWIGLAVASGPASSAPSASTQQRTVEDASAGTIFRELIKNDGRTRIQVGLVKRGRSGELLYNPSTERVLLDRGDVLVDRNGAQYVVAASQRIDGGSGAVGPGGRVYPGETGTRFVGFESGSLTGVPNQGAGGWVLDLVSSVPDDQRVGLYADPAGSTLTVSVQEARVGSVTIFNRNGGEIAPNTSIQPSGFVVVRADVNFLDAERARIAMVDPETGRTITAGAMSREEAMRRFPESAGVIARLVPVGKAQPEGRDGSARSLANPANQPSTTVYLIQDLGAVQKAGTYQIIVGGDTSSPFGGLSRAGVSRSVGLTVEFAPRTTTPDGSVEPPSITSPAGSYRIGDRVAVSGRAEPSVDAVALYARRGDDWELVPTDPASVPVDSDGNWTTGPVDLSALDDRFTVPGTYDLGVIAVADADVNGDETPDETLTADRFDAGYSVTRPVVVSAARPTTTEPTTTPETTTVTGTTTATTPTASPTTTTSPTEGTTITTTQGTTDRPMAGFGPGLGIAALFLGVAVLVRVTRRRGGPPRP